MTQCIIPGCEANPDPKDVIIIDHTKPMKEINMNETKSNAMDNADIPESFKAFLATGSSVIQTCRDLVHVTEIQKDEILRLRDENERLRRENAERTAEPPSDYQTLKDFKGEMDAIHEEFDIPRDVNELRKTLEYAKSIKEIIEEKTDMDFSLPNALQNLRDLLDDYNTYKEACDNHTIDPDELDGKLDDYDAMDMACSDHGVEPKDLDDALTEWEDNDKYKKGFEELSEFVEKIKEVIGHCGDDIPSTDVEDYD